MSQLEGEVLLTSSGWRPRMLLNILQCTGQHRIVKAEMPIMLRLGNSVLFYETKNIVICSSTSQVKILR